MELPSPQPEPSCFPRWTSKKELTTVRRVMKRLMKSITGSSSARDEVIDKKTEQEVVQETQKEMASLPAEITDADDSNDEEGDYTDTLTFKRFDMVEDFSDHHYASSCTKQPPKAWAKKIQTEWKILLDHLPDTIFVRVCESRMDLLRTAIIGAEGTPYHDGLFFFDVFFPNNYPSVPPQVYYHSRGHRINPNLDNSGYVCLSLLNTWSGSTKEMWIPKKSTILQVLVSIQGLILNAKPYFNEPAYAGTSGTLSSEKQSQKYSENTLILSLKTMVYSIRNPPKHFEGLVAGHFFRRARDILEACKAYIDGAQVGCLVKGVVQDAGRQDDTRCSVNFRNQLAQYITTLVEAFKTLNIEDCDEFLCLAQKATSTGNTTPKKN